MNPGMSIIVLILLYFNNTIITLIAIGLIVINSTYNIIQGFTNAGLNKVLQKYNIDEFKENVIKLKAVGKNPLSVLLITTLILATVVTVLNSFVVYMLQNIINNNASNIDTLYLNSALILVIVSTQYQLYYMYKIYMQGRNAI